MDIVIVQQLIDRHFEIWNDTDAARRNARFAQVYTDNFYVADYDGVVTGYAAVAALIDKVQGGHAGFIFTPEPVAWNHDIGRVTWGYGPKDQPNLIRGEDIFTIRNGKLASAYVFIDKNKE